MVVCIGLWVYCYMAQGVSGLGFGVWGFGVLGLWVWWFGVWGLGF